MIPNLKETVTLIKEVGPIIVPIFEELLKQCTKCPREVFSDPKRIALIILQLCHGKTDPVKVTKIFVGLVCGQGGGWIAFTTLSVLFPGVGTIIGSLVALAGNYLGSELGKEIIDYVIDANNNDGGFSGAFA